MKLNKKYASATMIAFFMAVAFSAGPVPAQDTGSKSFQLNLYRSAFDYTVQQLSKKITYIGDLNKKATAENDNEMLSHTAPAIKEILARINETCIPLEAKVRAAYAEQAKLHPGFAAKPDQSFITLFSTFERECSAGVLPTIERMPDGKVISDVTLNRPALQYMRLDVLIETNKKASNAIDQLEDALKTQRNNLVNGYGGGDFDVNRARSHADKMKKIYNACVIENESYKKFIESSNDLIKIRRRKANFERICNGRHY